MTNVTFTTKANAIIFIYTQNTKTGLVLCIECITENYGSLADFYFEQQTLGM